MPDDTFIGKQAASTRRSVGSKDAKQTKHNRNITMALPDRGKEQATEERVKGEMAKKGRGHRPPGGAYKLDVLDEIVRLRRQGLNIRQIALVQGLPGYEAIYELRRHQPSLKEEMDNAYNDYVREEAESMLPLASKWGDEKAAVELIQAARRMEEVDDLKGTDKVMAIDKMIARTVDISTAVVNAQDKRVNRTLQISRARLEDWREDTERGGEVIVFEVAGGWAPEAATATTADPEGQGVEAAAARKRWQEIRRAGQAD